MTESDKPAKCWYCGKELSGPFKYVEVTTEAGKQEVAIHTGHVS